MRTGILSPVTEAEIANLAGGHEAHRDATGSHPRIDHSCHALHNLRCTDKCPRGRSSPWPRLTLAPTALPSFLA